MTTTATKIIKYSCGETHCLLFSLPACPCPAHPALLMPTQQHHYASLIHPRTPVSLRSKVWWGSRNSKLLKALNIPQNTSHTHTQELTHTEAHTHTHTQAQTHSLSNKYTHRLTHTQSNWEGIRNFRCSAKKYAIKKCITPKCEICNTSHNVELEHRWEREREGEGEGKVWI